jgi:hypothetical protein
MQGDPNWAEVVSDVIGVIGLGAVVAAIVALAKSNKQNAFSNVIACENMMLAARTRMSDAIAANVRALNNVVGNPASINAEQALTSKVSEECTEAYLNTVDRLCAALLRADITEEVYRADYRPLINEIMKTYARMLGPDTNHRNIVKVFDKWADH